MLNTGMKTPAGTGRVVAKADIQNWNTVVVQNIIAMFENNLSIKILNIYIF
jgi:hypothetical protein